MVFIIVTSARIGIIRLAVRDVLTGNRRTILVADIVTTVSSEPGLVIPIAAAIINADVIVSVAIAPTPLNILVASLKSCSVPFAVAKPEEASRPHPGLIATAGAFPFSATK